MVADNIKKTFDDFYEEIEMVDLLRDCLLKEESENYTIFDENDRS